MKNYGYCRVSRLWERLDSFLSVIFCGIITLGFVHFVWVVEDIAHWDSSSVVTWRFVVTIVICLASFVMGGLLLYVTTRIDSIVLDPRFLLDRLEECHKREGSFISSFWKEVFAMICDSEVGRKEDIATFLDFFESRSHCYFPLVKKAVLAGESDVLDSILKYAGNFINKKDEKGNTLVHCVVEDISLKNVLLLYLVAEHGGDFFVENLDGVSPVSMLSGMVLPHTEDPIEASLVAILQSFVKGLMDSRRAPEGDDVMV